MPANHDPTENHLLAALAPEERERIFPQLERLCCECYSVVKKEEDRLLTYVPPRAQLRQVLVR